MSGQTNRGAPGHGNETSGQSVPKSRFRKRSKQEQTAASKIRMEQRGEKLEAARDKLAKQKPPKKPGPGYRGSLPKPSEAGSVGRGGATEQSGCPPKGGRSGAKFATTMGRAVGGSVHDFVHGKIYEVEHENVGVEGAHRAELAGEAVYRYGRRRIKKAIREHPAKTAARAESKYIKATADYHFRVTAQEHPELDKNALSRFWKKKQLQKQYRKQAKKAAKTGAKAAEKTAVTTEKLAARTVAFVKRYPVGTLIALACALLIFTLQSCSSSLVTVGNGLVGAVAASTYQAEDADLWGAEAAYCALEDELREYLDIYEATHSYDEYHFDLDDIEHDPYVLLSMLSALHEGAWTVDEVRGILQTLFDRQYILTETVVTERRYYIETDTWTDEEGNTHTDSYRVYYNYYICTVTLENFNLSHVPIYMMGEEQLSRYALYMATLGNRPDLFPSSPYVGKYITTRPADYEVPEAYLADETFAAILKEAEKYIGFPYVWGGYSPGTSFDCSGFVSYIYNQCGWDFGRLGAQGLYNISARTNSPKPGDLVFFTGTYDTPGVSHCGIYVGDGWMLHAGDPIQYSNLNTSYWQSHFYAYGKLY